LKKVADGEKPLEELETESFGINHVELGAKYIEKLWPVLESAVDQIKKAP
jgi:hypothetical protein